MAFDNVVRCIVWSLRHVKFKYFIQSVKANTMSYSNMKFDGLPRTAYIQRKDSNEFFSLSIVVEYAPLRVARSFTFWRNVDSTIYSFLTRVDLKISNYMEKKMRKTSVDFKLPSVESKLFKDGEQISANLPCSYLFEEEGGYVMKILDQSYDIVCNAPWVNNMSLPKKILTNTVIYPLKFEADHFDKEKSVFKWYRSEAIAAYIKSNIVHVKDWIEIGDKFFYLVQDEDVGHYLKLVCIPKNNVTTGPKFTTISGVPVTASRNDYYFVKTHGLIKEKVDDSKFRIVTYNLLADNYVCTKESKVIFDYCSTEVLQKEQRYAALTWEISGYNADILCLQEVDCNIHNNYIMGRLENEGYGGILCSKAIDKEGTACYYNKKKFNLISSERFTFGQEIMANCFLKDIYSYLQQNQNLTSKFCELPHCLQILVLQSISRQDHLIILGNIHLFSQPEADLIRLLQSIISFKIYEYIMVKLKDEKINHKVSFIMCGDFNSTPECSINEMIMKGSISSDHPIWSSEKMTGLSYKIPVNMASAFPDAKYTNYTRTFKGCLDYIYYQTNELILSKTYPLPEECELSEYVGLPSVHFPSDHLPLIAEFQWKT